MAFEYLIYVISVGLMMVAASFGTKLSVKALMIASEEGRHLTERIAMSVLAAIFVFVTGIVVTTMLKWALYNIISTL